MLAVAPRCLVVLPSLPAGTPGTDGGSEGLVDLPVNPTRGIP
jgi:hypothetical protein